MEDETKEQIITIIKSLYQIPGQYFIAGVVSIGIGKAILDFTNWGLVLIILGIIFIALEIISPIIAGVELYEKGVKRLEKFLKDIS